MTDKMTNQVHSEKETAEQELEALREELSQGGFGLEIFENGGAAEPAAFDGEPDEAVAGFIASMGQTGFSPFKGYDWKAYVPSELLADNGFSGPLHGVIREETQSIYVFDSPAAGGPIGWVFGSGSGKTPQELPPRGEGFFVEGEYENGALTLRLGCPAIRLPEESGAPVCAPWQYPSYQPVRLAPYDLAARLFSRNSGLLESASMLDCCAVLIGCGSVGSFAAMELARSGVGRFVLCDTDTLEIHNICRHQCGFDDLGRYKVDAVRDKILRINPRATVVTFRSVIQRVPEEELLPYLGRKTVIIGGGDNRASADWACKLAIRTDSAFVAAGCWTRAFAGEIFYWASGLGLSCYSCALGGLIDDERPESHAAYFGSEEEQESLAFEPGIAADIDFVTVIALKVALDLINRDNPDYTPRVIHYLRQYTWVCNTNSTRIGGERAGIFAHPLQITHNLRVHHDPHCPWCGDGREEDREM